MGYAVESGGLTEWAVTLPCGMAALLTPFPVVPWRDMVSVEEANLGWVCTWHTYPAGMDPREWQAKAVMTYLSWSLPAAPGGWAQWWDRALSWARDGSAVAACPDLPRDHVSVQPWTVSLHLPTVAARLAATDPEVLPLGDRERPGFRLGRGLEVRTARLPSPVDRDILEGLQFTRADGADVWTAVHRRLPDAWIPGVPAPWSRAFGGSGMARVGYQQPVPAGSGPAQGNQPPQLGDSGGLVGMGGGPWDRWPRLHCPMGHGDRDRRGDGVEARGRAPDHACGGGCPQMGSRQATALARSGRWGCLARPAGP